MRLGVIHYVDLDGGWGEEILNKHLDHFKNAAPDRFSIFGGIDWNQWREKGNTFPEWAAKRLHAQKERGADGLKIWKPFGLQVTDHQGKLVNIDDDRLIPIWETAGELDLPVVIHVADPVAFFDPIDETNERWEEIVAHPDWAFTSPPFPSFMQIMNGLKSLVLRHSSTIFHWCPCGMLCGKPGMGGGDAGCVSELLHRHFCTAGRTRQAALFREKVLHPVSGSYSLWLGYGTGFGCLSIVLPIP